MKKKIVKESNPVLYILMRIDLTSLNPGKAMAQASHASNAFVKALKQRHKSGPLRRLYDQWESETPQGFGTCIVLAAPWDKIRQIILDLGDSLVDFTKGVVHDPSYPLRDGEVTHLIPLDTCAYVFCDRDNRAREYMRDLPLHR